MPGLTLRDADLGTGCPVDVRVANGVVVGVGPTGVARDGDVVECGGRAVLPGLHDHHIHLLAAAAAADSVSCGPPRVRDRSALGAQLRAATPRHGWIRGVGYDDGAVGDLDRQALDALRSGVPVRLQHRSGALWVLNSAGLRAVGAHAAEVDGIERDAAGYPTGRLWRLDRWLGDRVGPQPAPDLGRLGRRLTGLGVTGVTDATPDLDPATVSLLTSGELAQRVTLLGDPAGSAPWKIVLADHEALDPDRLANRIRAVRPRPVALHCVSRVALVLALAALETGGARPGDRIEHAAVCPPELARRLAALRVTVVTQPSLVALRGDDYLDRVDPEDVDALWPYASLLASGVAVGCSSDAPYGGVDPWRSIAAAGHRTAPSGRVVGAREAVPAATALTGFLTSPGAPGGRPRTVRIGAPADLIVLDRSRAGLLAEPGETRVRLTLIAGRVAYENEPVPA